MLASRVSSWSVGGWGGMAGLPGRGQAKRGRHAKVEAPGAPRLPGPRVSGHGTSAGKPERRPAGSTSTGPHTPPCRQREPRPLVLVPACRERCLARQPRVNAAAAAASRLWKVRVSLSHAAADCPVSTHTASPSQVSGGGGGGGGGVGVGVGAAAGWGRGGWGT